MSVGAITGVNATLAVDAYLLTNVPSVPVNTPLRHAEPNKCNLFSLGISPINAVIVEKSLIEYPLPDKRKELISGLKFGFKLQYSGTRLPIRSKNSKSISEHSELVLRKINNEVQVGRIAGPFIEPSFPTLRVSPIFLAPKKNGEFRLIHNLSHPSENSLNDFIDPEFCSVRYAGIDDAVDMKKRIGKEVCCLRPILRAHLDC